MRYSPLPLLLAGIMVLLCGCTSRRCQEDACGSHGSCHDNECLCNPGYGKDEAGKCSIRLAAAWEGVYNTDVSGCQTGNYVITLQSSQVFDDILLLINLGGYRCSNGEELVVEARVTSASKFTIEPSRYCEKYQISGSGQVENNRIRLDYRVEYAASEATGTSVEEQCQVILKKR
jgi:hypothetical protein